MRWSQYFRSAWYPFMCILSFSCSWLTSGPVQDKLTFPRHLMFLNAYIISVCFWSAICWHWNGYRPSMMYSQPLRKYQHSLAHIWIVFSSRGSCGFSAFNLLLCTYCNLCTHHFCCHLVRHCLYLCTWSVCIIISVIPIDDGVQWASHSISFASVPVSSYIVLSLAIVSEKIAVMFQGHLCIYRIFHTYFLWHFPVSLMWYLMRLSACIIGLVLI